MNNPKWQILDRKQYHQIITPADNVFAGYTVINSINRDNYKSQNILAERKTFFKNIDHNPNFAVFPNQKHTANITVVDKSFAGKGSLNKESAIDNCDGLITREDNLLICIQTADCVPVFVSDKKGSFVSVLHAGWRGTANKILPKAVEILQGLYRIAANSILVYAGPCIQKCCYKVGEELKDHLKCIDEKEGKFYADLMQENKIQAIDCGIPEENFSHSPYCTSCRGDLFYSYRRDKGNTGRIISFIKKV